MNGNAERVTVNSRELEMLGVQIETGVSWDIRDENVLDATPRYVAGPVQQLGASGDRTGAS